MNIDISNAHCGPRIQFPDHAWLRVVSIEAHCLRRLARSRLGVALDTHACRARARAGPRIRARIPYGVRAIVGRSPECGRSIETALLLYPSRVGSSREPKAKERATAPVRDCRSGVVRNDGKGKNVTERGALSLARASCARACAARCRRRRPAAPSTPGVLVVRAQPYTARSLEREPPLDLAASRPRVRVHESFFLGLGAGECRRRRVPPSRRSQSPREPRARELWDRRARSRTRRA